MARREGLKDFESVRRRLIHVGRIISANEVEELFFDTDVPTKNKPFEEEKKRDFILNSKKQRGGTRVERTEMCGNVGRGST